MRRFLLPTLILVLLLPDFAGAETGQAAWLRYARLDTDILRRYERTLPLSVMTWEDTAPIQKARDELRAGIQGMLGREVTMVTGLPPGGAILAGTLAGLRRAVPGLVPDGTLLADGYWLRTAGRHVVIAGESERGVLYGTFALLRMMALGQPLTSFAVKAGPYAPIRWVNEWNNIDGSIERGYGGRSIFWDGGHIREDLGRVNEYGRLLASLGVNGISINNVNANPLVLSPDFVPQVARVADVLRPWGVRLALAIDRVPSPRPVFGPPPSPPWRRKRRFALTFNS